MWSVTGLIPPDAQLEVEDAKGLMRSGIRARRQERTVRERDEAAQGIARNASSLLQGVSCATVYASRPGEPNTAPLIDAMHEQEIRVLLPILGVGLKRDWAPYERGDDLAVRAPGRPPEPDVPGLGEDAIAQANLVIVPALSVDLHGTRIGQGGGWYDRVLLHARPEARIYAVVFDDEISPQPLPRAEHDQQVHGIITPGSVHHLSAA